MPDRTFHFLKELISRNLDCSHISKLHDWHGIYSVRYQLFKNYFFN